MDFTPNCVEHRVLIFGHSYVKRLSTFCCAHGWINLGLPSMYNIQMVGLSGAPVQAFAAWAHGIIGFKLEFIIVDLGGNDVAHPTDHIDIMVAELFVHLRKILDCLPACLFTRVVINEHHNCSRVPHSIIHYSLYSTLLRDWHQHVVALHLIDDHISFQRLWGFNGNHWFCELSDGVHLTMETQWDYLRTLQYVIRKAYRF